MDQLWSLYGYVNTRPVNYGMKVYLSIPKLQLNSNLAKTCLSIPSILGARMLWYFAQNTAVSLLSEVSKSKTLLQMGNKLWTNRFLWDVSLQMLRKGHSILQNRSGFHRFATKQAIDLSWLLQENSLRENAEAHHSICELPGYEPLTRYLKLRVAYAPGMPGTFPPPPTSRETAS